MMVASMSILWMSKFLDNGPFSAVSHLPSLGGGAVPSGVFESF